MVAYGYATGSRINQLQTLRTNPPRTISKLLGEEGLAAAAYFRCWHSFPLQWKGLGRKLIPDDWHRIGARMSSRKGNQFARHPVNAILNYCYAVLQNQVQAVIVASGFDPYIGYIHSDDMKSKPKLVFDLMEPLRPMIDQTILHFVRNHIFSPADFVLNTMGVCRLHPQFARVVVKLVQDNKDVEPLTQNNLGKLLALQPKASHKAFKNIGEYKARLIGRRK